MVEMPVMVPLQMECYGISAKEFKMLEDWCDVPNMWGLIRSQAEPFGIYSILENYELLLLC